jgi:hypothetical protein
MLRISATRASFHLWQLPFTLRPLSDPLVERAVLGSSHCEAKGCFSAFSRQAASEEGLKLKAAWPGAEMSESGTAVSSKPSEKN